ncbi:MAG: xanthine dehydrogenase family protein subunit M [Pseudomonadota bacterium]
MKPAAFTYERPDTLSAALEMLAECTDDARILAGGQSLVPMMNTRLARPDRLIDINRVPDLDYIRREGDQIRIGALARHADVKQSDVVRDALPLINEAYEWIAHGAVRNRGTLCGNLCHADPASEMPAIMQVLGATFVAQSQEGRREIPADAFFTGLYETALKPTEILVEVRVPVMAPNQSWGFHEVSMRKGDFAWVLVACVVTWEGSVVSSARLTAAGIADRALRLHNVENAVAGQALTPALCETAGATARQTVDPSHDAVTSAEYRRDLIGTLVNRALSDAAGRASHS